MQVVRVADGTFSLFEDRLLTHGEISERSLGEQLCVRFGFCGDEFQGIVAEVTENGSKTILL